MNLQEFKNIFIKEELKIGDSYGRIFSFIDFSNVNKWFERDRQDSDLRPLAYNEKLCIDLEKLKDFAFVFSKRVRIYYGKDPFSEKSEKFIYFLRKQFGKYDVITKNIQRIKHYLIDGESIIAEFKQKDKHGKDFIEIRKCNFDVEISVDALKLLKYYDTFCIFSGDADFVYLNRFLKSRGKKIIVIKSGNILHTLRNSADLVINAQQIKKYITYVRKQEPGENPSSCG